MELREADARVARIAARQHGRIDVRDLRRCGLSRDAVHWRVQAKRLHQVHHGVYAVGFLDDDDRDAAFMGAVLAGGKHAALSGWATLALNDLVAWDDRTIDVTLRRGNRRNRDGIRLHRRRLETRDVTKRRGIRTVTVAWALVECAPLLSEARLTRLVRQAQLERLASVRQLADVVRRTRGAGSRRVAAIIVTGPAPTASGHEDDVLDIVLDAGFVPPDVNVPYPGTTYKPDLRWPAQRLVLEVDSAWHDDPAAQRADAARQADLEAAGERVLRTTREQALRDPAQLIRRLRLAGAPLVSRKSDIGRRT